jgi:hypothetical protein
VLRTDLEPGIVHTLAIPVSEGKRHEDLDSKPVLGKVGEALFQTNPNKRKTK